MFKKIIVAFLSITYSVEKVSSYQTLTSITICDGTQLSGVDDGATPYFRGTYTRSTDAVTEDDIGLYLPFSNQDITTDWIMDYDSTVNRYYFGEDENTRLRFKYQTKEELFFQYLFANHDNNNCDCNTVQALSDFTGSAVDNCFDKDNIDATLDELVACSTWEHVDDPDTSVADIYNPAENILNIDGTFTTGSNLDNMNCNPSGSKLCHELSEYLGIEYKGFEVYTDTNCIDIVRTGSPNLEGWRCKTCDTGYRKFANGDFEGGGNAIHKCRHEDTYFPNCASHANRGCRTCNSGYQIKEWTWPTWGNYCPYGYCYLPDDDSLIQDTDPVTLGGIPRMCWTQEQRVAAERDGYDDQNGNPVPAPTQNDYETGRFWIADPWNQTECIIGAIAGDAVYCIEDGLCDHDDTAGCHEDGSCSQCLGQPYDNFKLSRFHRCQDVSATFGGGCLLGNEGYGCGQCDGNNVETEYNEASDVWFCPGTSVIENVEDYTSNNQDKIYSAWVCPQYANDDTAFWGAWIEDNENDALGVDCQHDLSGETYFEADGSSRVGKCVDCEPGSLCSQCENDNSVAANDWFRPSDFHFCQNCAETFGPACNFCDDYRGCSQCDEGYILQYDVCCGLWYCI